MTLEISHFRTVATNGPVAQEPIFGASQSLSLTSSPAAATPSPSNAQVISISATEAARFEYTSDGTAVTATSNYVAVGERLWFKASPGWVLSARTA